MNKKNIFLFANALALFISIISSSCNSDPDEIIPPKPPITGQTTPGDNNGGNNSGNDSDSSNNNEGNDSGSNNDSDGNNGSENNGNNNRGAVAKTFRGSGTQSDPYIISDATELRKLSDECASGKTYRNEYFKMTADVTINRNVLDSNGDLNGDGSRFEEWIPIKQFQGVFDGNGHSISGVYINAKNRFDKSSNDTYPNCGLFGILYTGGEIKGLTLKDSFLKIYNYGDSDCSIGGICGLSHGVINTCINYATVISDGKYGRVGGLVGRCEKGDNNPLTKCVNYGKIMAIGSGGACYIGGISGYLHSVSTTKSEKYAKWYKIKDCANYGTIIGSDRLSGIAGGVFYVRILNCANYGDVISNRDGKDEGCGICVGNGELRNCINMGKAYYGFSFLSERSDFIRCEIYRGYALETSYTSLYSIKCDFKSTNSKFYGSMTEKEMKSQEFLDELNDYTKTLGSDFSKWKFGKDGFPTLDFVKE